MVFNSKPIGTVYHGDGTRTEYYSDNTTGFITGETKGTRYDSNLYTSSSQVKVEEPTLFTRFLSLIFSLVGAVAMAGVGIFVLEIIVAIIYFMFFH